MMPPCLPCSEKQQIPLVVLGWVASLPRTGWLQAAGGHWSEVAVSGIASWTCCNTISEQDLWACAGATAVCLQLVSAGSPGLDLALLTWPHQHWGYRKDKFPWAALNALLNTVEDSVGHFCRRPVLLAQTQLTVQQDITELLCKAARQLHKSPACASAWSYSSLPAGWCNCSCCALSHSSLSSSAFHLLRFPWSAAHLSTAPSTPSTFICSLNLLESVLSHPAGY